MDARSKGPAQVQTIYVLAGPPGSGKSYFMRGTVISQPGLYLVAVPATELADEQCNDYARDAPSLWLRTVHHRDGRLGSVERKFEAALEEIAAKGVAHAVVFITQESLLTLDLSSLSNWHVLIDEVPRVVRSGTLSVPMSHSWLAQTYGLDPVGRGWSMVSPLTSTTRWHVRKRDSLYEKIAEFDQEARREHGALVNAETWEQVAGRGTLDWTSVWTPANLSHCASITIAGAGFYGSIAHRAVTWLHPDIKFEKQPIPARPRAVLPTLRLHYFVEAHRGSCTYWATREGRSVLAPIRQFLAQIGDLGFWSGNKVIEEQFDIVVKAQFVRPKAVVGSNELTEHTSCAFIYSAQMLPEDRPLLLFGVGKAEIEHSREFEDLYQFVMRGRLRDPSFGGIFDAYVYSRAQAEKIASRATEDGVATIEFVPHPEVGVMGVIRPTRRPEPSPEDKDAKRQARRDRDRLRKKEARASAARAAGRTGRPGRPAKTSHGNPNAG